MTAKQIVNKVEQKLSHTVNSLIADQPNFSERVRFLLAFYLKNKEKLHTIETMAVTYHEVLTRLDSIEKRYKEVFDLSNALLREREKHSKYGKY